MEQMIELKIINLLMCECLYDGYLSRATSVGIKFMSCAAISEFFASASVFPVRLAALVSMSYEYDRLFLCCGVANASIDLSLSLIFGNDKFCSRCIVAPSTLLLGGMSFCRNRERHADIAIDCTGRSVANAPVVSRWPKNVISELEAGDLGDCEDSSSPLRLLLNGADSRSVFVSS